MMGLLRDWLLGVTAAALLAALAQSLMPPGPVKKAGGLVCGLVLLWAVFSPLAGGLDQLPPLPAQDYLEQVELRARELQEQVQEQRKAVIEDELNAYILDKAAQQGIVCQVQITCRAGEEGLFVPAEAQLSAPEEAWPQLSRILTEDLGITAQRQTYEKEAAS